MLRRLHDPAFTLIELLIVVAIIAILAAIAVPNFLEAQTRSKVSRVKADMRSLATGLEAYAVDYNQYALRLTLGVAVTLPNQHPSLVRLLPLTTPVSYLTSIPEDAFRHLIAGGSNHSWENDPLRKAYMYSRGDVRAGSTSSLGNRVYTMNSSGPDNNIASDSYYTVDEMISFERLNNSVTPARYDPTNGTVSQGDIFRWGPDQTIN
jgi:prepilin-type N-terminal cleavage/methylation domain-containing protein